MSVIYRWTLCGVWRGVGVGGVGEGGGGGVVAGAGWRSDVPY